MRKMHKWIISLIEFVPCLSVVIKAISALKTAIVGTDHDQVICDVIIKISFFLNSEIFTGLHASFCLHETVEGEVNCEINLERILSNLKLNCFLLPWVIYL